MSSFDADWLVPGWVAPGVGAVMTTRRGGVSVPPFDSLNLRDSVGDDPAAVARNEALFAAAVGAPVAWMTQVHGTRVLRLGAAGTADAAGAAGAAGVAGAAGAVGGAGGAGGRAAAPPPAAAGGGDAASAARPTADACVTSEAGVVCAVQVADCLPVLFTAPNAAAVGAAHAGWRGLASGVLEATVDAVCDAAQCQPQDLQAWLGACIGPRSFEVGQDVVEAFGGGPHFTPKPDTPGKWLADLPALARQRLKAKGLDNLHGGTWCTVEDRSRFFSYRRDGARTGRMAAAIWITRR